jgi:1-acyl-sn-glycerol-3-phosphate acyltransferase
MRYSFRIIFYLISRVVVTGQDNVPVGRPYLIAINHVSIFEAPLVAAFWPEFPEAAGAVEIWSRPGQSLLARAYGGIPVHRGEYDRKLLQTLLQVLESGRPLLIAPEGGRSHRPGMRRAQPGIAYLIDKADLPIIPVGIVGSTDDFFAKGIRGERPQIEMHIGNPIQLPKITSRGKARREARQRNADLVMYKIAKLMPSEYRGVYGDAPQEK